MLKIAKVLMSIEEMKWTKRNEKDKKKIKNEKDNRNQKIMIKKIKKGDSTTENKGQNEKKREQIWQ